MSSSLAHVLNTDTRDQADPLRDIKGQFHIPNGMIYLDGNSLGLLPKASQAHVQETLTEQWGNSVITSWNKHGWINLPLTVGDQIGAIIGAPAGHTLCCDSTSINLFKVLYAALQLNPGRTEIVSTRDNFPTDLYMVQGLSQLLGQNCRLRLVEEHELMQAVNEQTAALLVTEVNFRTGRKLPIKELANYAHSNGALLIADLAHSAGAMPVNVYDNHVDFAIGCTYKYMNGGPGAPAFLYVAPQNLTTELSLQPLYGWLGHAEPFAFDPDYTPAAGIRQFLTGTPPVLAMASVHAALRVFEQVSMADIRAKSVALSETWLEAMAQKGLLEQMPCISPETAEHRGSQLAFQHEHAYAICQALIAEGVVADFRAPHYLRIGFAPLYNSFTDIANAVDVLARIMQTKRYTRAEFQQRQSVT
ncbi:kynureninase [Aliidiomarina celeris]|uniref:kynureninase n=1 Tax=Aliidiomarina celeris TaxID=2249428 RepID=UPI000DE92B5F|nr:kynureninase [Aliidiomarina celeris]